MMLRFLASRQDAGVRGRPSFPGAVVRVVRALVVRGLIVAGLVVAGLVGGGCAPPPLLEAPGARAVAVARTADAVILAEALERAGLVDAAALRAAGPALVADAPFIISVLPDGVVIVATRVDAKAGAALLAAPSRPVLGKTRAVVVEGAPLLVRTDRSRVLAALFVPPAREATIAATLELMAGAKSPPAPVLPAPGTTVVRVAAGVSPIELGVVDATVRLAGDTLEIDARAPAPAAEVVAALAAPSPPWACGLEKGAALVVHVPPLPGVADDAFRGRMLVAGYPEPGGTGLLVAGVPADEQELDASIAPLLETGRAVVRTEGSARVLEVRGERRVRIVRAPGIFVIAVEPGGGGEGGRENDGAGAIPLERIGAADGSCSPSALVRVDSAALTRLLLPMVLTKEGILEALVRGDVEGAATPAVLRGVSRVEIDGETEGGGIRLRARVGLRAVQD